MKKVILNFKGEQHELTTDEEPGQVSSASPNGYAPTDSGIHELDEPINTNHPEIPDSWGGGNGARRH